MAHYLMGGDKVFLGRAVKYFGIKNVRIAWSNLRKRYPDIWVDLSKEVPVITVTAEWLRQTADERRKRLVHEIGHIFGLEHGKMHGLVYSTYPGRDFWSKAVYKDIISGSKKFDPWEFC